MSDIQSREIINSLTNTYLLHSHHFDFTNPVRLFIFSLNIYRQMNLFSLCVNSLVQFGGNGERFVRENVVFVHDNIGARRKFFGELFVKSQTHLNHSASAWQFISAMACKKLDFVTCALRYNLFKKSVLPYFLQYKSPSNISRMKLCLMRFRSCPITLVAL